MLAFYTYHQHLSLLVFTGTIPAFSTLTNLNALNVHSNSLTGEHSNTCWYTRMLVSHTNIITNTSLFSGSQARFLRLAL